MKNKKKKGRVLIVLLPALTLAVMLATIWLAASGYLEAAMEALMRMGEDGTVDRFKAYVVDELLPVGVSILAGLGGLLAALANVLRKLKEARETMDTATAEAVRTYGEREDMKAEMQAFMKKQMVVMDAMQAEQANRLNSLETEHRESLAADRAAIRRIEGKVDGLRRIEVAAFGSTAELVKKGMATQIVQIYKDTEGAEVSLQQEGGEDGEACGDDNEAAEDSETD